MKRQRSCVDVPRLKIMSAEKKRMEKAKCTVERQFGKYLPKTAIELLKTAVELIEEDQIDSLTLDVGNGLKGKISMTSKGNIKVEKTAGRADRGVL